MKDGALQNRKNAFAALPGSDVVRRLFKASDVRVQQRSSSAAYDADDHDGYKKFDKRERTVRNAAPRCVAIAPVAPQMCSPPG